MKVPWESLRPEGVLQAVLNTALENLNDLYNHLYDTLQVIVIYVFIYRHTTCFNCTVTLEEPAMKSIIAHTRSTLMAGALAIGIAAFAAPAQADLIFELDPTPAPAVAA